MTLAHARRDLEVIEEAYRDAGVSRPDGADPEPARLRVERFGGSP